MGKIKLIKIHAGTYFPRSITGKDSWYDVTLHIEHQPNWFMKLLGAKPYTKRYFSSVGVYWHCIDECKDISIFKPLNITLSRIFEALGPHIERLRADNEEGRKLKEAEEALKEEKRLQDARERSRFERLDC